MRITFTMSVRDELPDLLNQIARQHGEPETYEVTMPIDLMLQIEWPSAPREGESVSVIDVASPRTVESVTWDIESGEVRVALEELDTDEAGREAAVVQLLLDRGWTVDTEMMGWSSQNN